MNQVTVEFFGIPRQRAGRARMSISANTIAELLCALEKSCPGLEDLRQADGQLASHYLLSLDGQRFLGDLQQELQPGDKVLLLSADVGG